MILGIGIDISDISEFESRLNDPLAAFLNVHFTSKEIAYAKAQISGEPAQHIASAYSAKEACIKAFDQARGIKFAAVRPLDYKDIEISHAPNGAPEIILHGSLAKLKRSIGVENIFLTLSHDKGYAVACVICEK